MTARRWWAIGEGRRRILLALVVPAVLSLAGTVALSVLTIGATSALSDNVRLTQDLVDGNVRTLSQVQRELLRLDAALGSATPDPERIELARSLAAQRIQEGTLDYQGRTLGDASLLARSRDLAARLAAATSTPPSGPSSPTADASPRPAGRSSPARCRPSSWGTTPSSRRPSTCASGTPPPPTRPPSTSSRTRAGCSAASSSPSSRSSASWPGWSTSSTAPVVPSSCRPRGCEAARAQLQRHSVAVQATDNLVLITDEDGRIEWVNDAFTRHTGYTIEEVAGQVPGHLLQGPDTSAETVAFMRERVTTHEPFTCEVLNYDRHGASYWISLEVRPIVDHDRVTGFVAVQSDITAQRATEDALRRAKETAEESAAAKQRFLASMSHEIRTPLNAVLGLTELLLDTELADDQRQYVHTAHQSGRHLLAIVNDILDFSALESGAVETESTSADVRALLDDVCAMLRPQADRGGLGLSWEAEAGVPDLRVHRRRRGSARSSSTSSATG